MTKRQNLHIIKRMKSNSTINERQNHPQAITLIKASYRCSRAEKLIRYLMIFLSFSTCLAAIFNRYLPTLLPNLENLEQVQKEISTYLNLISGAVLVAGLPLGFYCNRMSAESTVLRDRYDAYVFNNKENTAILRPISDTYIDLYAKKVGKDNKRFRNYIYGNETAPDDSVAQFEYIANEVRSDYNMHVSLQPFFLTVWIGFCLLIVVIAISFNDMFITTLINILIPSLSAITTIGTAWYNYKHQMRKLTNLITCVERIKALPPDEFSKYVANKDKMRELADGLFTYRSSAIVIPSFLIKIYQRSQEKAKIAATDKSVNTDKSSAEKTKTTETQDKETPTTQQQNDTKTTKDVAKSPKTEKKATTSKQTTTATKTVSGTNTGVKKTSSSQGKATLKPATTKQSQAADKTTKTTTATKTAAKSTATAKQTVKSATKPKTSKSTSTTDKTKK